VTPIVAIFPLINIYVDNQTAKLLLCAWIVAFFPDPVQHDARA
jgi:NitT/TauT family transport system permease protein